jgi:hypothetical protein
MVQPSLAPADRKHREEFAAFSIKHGHEAYRTILETLYGLWDGWNRDHFGHGNGDAISSSATGEDGNGDGNRDAISSSAAGKKRGNLAASGFPCQSP